MFCSAVKGVSFSTDPCRLLPCSCLGASCPSSLAGNVQTAAFKAGPCTHPTKRHTAASASLNGVVYKPNVSKGSLSSSGAVTSRGVATFLVAVGL